MNKFLTFCITLFICFLLSANTFGADKKSRIEVAIERAHEQQEFVPLNNMWYKDDAFNAVLAEPVLYKWQALTLNNSLLAQLMAAKKPAIILFIPKGDGSFYELELVRYNMLLGDFKVREVGAATTTDFNYTPGEYYRGIVKGYHGSIASFSFFNNEVWGVFSLPNVGNICLVPNKLNTTKGNGSYILYNDMDMKATHDNAGCGTDQLPKLPFTNSNTANRNSYSTCREVKEYFVVDYDSYVRGGANAGAIVAISNYITALYNMVATCYRNEGVYTSIKQIDVHTTTDAYHGLPHQSGAYLNAFADDQQNNIQGADLAMLFTTTAGYMGGVAWLYSLCSRYDFANTGSRYGPYAFANIDSGWHGASLPRYSWDINVVAHEIGHNLGSSHTHGCQWNGNYTMIDGCGPTANINYSEGACAMGPIPTGTVGGTMMSYCHLLSSVGINFANGFGPQPSQVIRDFVATAPCLNNYIPSSPINVKDTTIIADRECSDVATGITYYWADNNTADVSDDKLLLSIKKNGNDLGNLDSPVSKFKVSIIIDSTFGRGTGDTLAMPSGIAADVLYYNVASARYWKMTATQPVTDVQVMFPFTKTDLIDIDGSVPGNTITANDLKMYSVKQGLNPAPSSRLVNALANNISFYSHGSVASTTQWANTTIADTIIASVLTKDLYGGAMFFSYLHPVSVSELNIKNLIQFYPNPSSTSWLTFIPEVLGNVTINLYSVDGRLLRTQILKGGEQHEIKTSGLPTGLYYYHILSYMQIFTGTLQKY
jgi:hypothetical protein